MKKILLILLVALLSACIKVGEFTPESYKLYEMGKINCEKNPEKCHKGVPW